MKIRLEWMIPRNMSIHGIEDYIEILHKIDRSLKYWSLVTENAVIVWQGEQRIFHISLRCKQDQS